MLEKKSKSTKIDEICTRLPDWASSFFWETGTQMATTTRLAYAIEIDRFFDYLVTYLPDLSETEKNNITLEQIGQVTSQDISRYLTLYQNKGNMERTLARKRATLSSFFNYYVVNRKLPFNPVSAAARVKIHQSDDLIYLDTREQIDLLDSIDDGSRLTENEKKWHDKYRTRDLALVTLLLDTGMRVSELHGIDIADVDLEVCSVIIIRKGGNIQTLYFSDSTRDILEEYIAERRKYDEQADGKYPLFTTTRGRRLSVRAIQDMVKKYAVAALPGKGKKISPHKMRSSFAMEFYEDQRDLIALQKKLNHKNLSTLKYYTEASDKRMRETRSVIENARAKAESKKK